MLSCVSVMHVKEHKLFNLRVAHCDVVVGFFSVPQVLNKEANILKLDQNHYTFSFAGI